MKRQCVIETPLGEMTVLAVEEGVCGLRFVGQKYEPAESGEWQEEQDHPLFVSLRNELAEYFAGRRSCFDLPLALHGTEFQLSVWELLRAIPAGETTTYGALARQLAGKRGGRIPSAQAVGGAVGHNPVAIIVPCHRVVGANGSLTGYAGGLERKAALLALEEAVIHPGLKG
jgi:methylated-DNA-[protein]-cysteine S-methyltransferase